MSSKKIVYNRIDRRQLILPDIPEKQRCDFRICYDAGMTLKDIAERYHCDPRTVRRCILANKPSTELGRQTEPTKLEPYVTRLETLYDECRKEGFVREGICGISMVITEQLKQEGYTGGERTVRNYLKIRYYQVIDPESSGEGK